MIKTAVPKCAGCALGHLSNASILLAEARKFELAGDRDLADKHIYAFLANIRQAEEQHPKEEMRKQIRDIRKQVELSIAMGNPIPNLESEIERKGIETLKLLRGHVELCPTCAFERKPAHEAFHVEG